MWEAIKKVKDKMGCEAKKEWDAEQGWEAKKSI